MDLGIEFFEMFPAFGKIRSGQSSIGHVLIHHLRRFSPDFWIIDADDPIQKGFDSLKSFPRPNVQLADCLRHGNTAGAFVAPFVVNARGLIPMRHHQLEWEVLKERRQIRAFKSLLFWIGKQENFLPCKNVMKVIMRHHFIMTYREEKFNKNGSLG